ncbi:MAG: hypothetical protein LUE21_09190 [Oscillospiraceae bacterium]|nr:hypothetical protein [Oscillospiraceae bacterium]
MNAAILPDEPVCFLYRSNIDLFRQEKTDDFYAGIYIKPTADFGGSYCPQISAGALQSFCLEWSRFGAKVVEMGEPSIIDSIKTGALHVLQRSSVCQRKHTPAEKEVVK